MLLFGPTEFYWQLHQAIGGLAYLHRENIVHGDLRGVGLYKIVNDFPVDLFEA